MEKILLDMHKAAVSRMDRPLARACYESVWVAAIPLLAFGSAVFEAKAAKHSLSEDEAARLERIRRAQAGINTIAKRWLAGAKAAHPSAIEDCRALLEEQKPEVTKALRTVTDMCFSTRGYFRLEKLRSGVGLSEQASLRCSESDSMLFADLLPKSLKRRGRSSSRHVDDWGFGGIFAGEETWWVRDAIRAENSLERSSGSAASSGATSSAFSRFSTTPGWLLKPSTWRRRSNPSPFGRASSSSRSFP